ncbi:MAG TPA: T9SS type A sorting domain-containing protein, partial [Candidatus Krumholzibacterium sp.]|nr:T9SS type A sorting domain-containing protein [Candidatus Krumholzibacterium sp.]
GVEDLNSNTIVDNNTTNVRQFFPKGILYKGRMSKHLETHTFPTDTFTVEGDYLPLTWGLCDNAFMTGEGGGVFTQEAIFMLDGAYDATDLTQAYEWKFVHQCSEYESISNRPGYLSSAAGAWDTIDVWWDDIDPTNYTAHPIDVFFYCDANSMSPGLDSIVAINGSVLPLTFDVPSLNVMADDGVAPDAAVDGIYTLKVRFPENSLKNAGYKFLYNGRYECQSEGDRDIWLNDSEFDTVGGTLGPLYMPLQYFDRCSVIGRDVRVDFRVLTKGFGGPADTVAVNGTPNNRLPEVINWNVPSINEMTWIDGFGDHTGLGYYTVSIVFPDSSSRYQEYKYLHNSVYECDIPGNRSFFIDDQYDAAGNPQVLEVDNFGSCITVDVPDGSLPTPIVLRQNYPNPFNPVTTIRFSVAERGHASLRIFDVRGALVKTLVDRIVDAGEVSILWDGTDDGGNRISSGVYFLNLRKGEETMTRKMIMLR